MLASLSRGIAVAHLAVPCPVVGQEVVREQRDVLGPLAERRKLDRNHAQAVEEVLAEHAGVDGLLRARGWWPR